jgi:hypothetical protein
MQPQFVNVMTASGETPIWWAAFHGKVDAVTALADLGADVNAPNDDNATPVWIAAQEGHEAVIKALHSFGADLNMSCDAGKTPVYVAAQYGHEAVVRTLHSLGADVSIPGLDGRSPLMAAQLEGHDLVRVALLEAGANASAPRWIDSRVTPGGTGFYLGMTGLGHDPWYPATVVAFTDWFVRNGWSRGTTRLITDLTRIGNNFRFLPEMPRGGDDPRSRNLLYERLFVADRPDDVVVFDVCQDVLMQTELARFNVGILHWCDHGGPAGAGRAGRALASSVPEMVGASVKVQLVSFVTIDILDKCFAWINGVKFFNRILVEDNPKNVILITAGTPPGTEDTITTQALDVDALAKEENVEYLTYASGGAEGEWSGTELGLAVLMRADEYANRPFLSFLEALTKTIRGTTHIHVFATEEALRRVGQRLTKEVLCIDASYKLPFCLSMRGSREELRRAGGGCEWIESVRMTESIAGENLADLEVRSVIERLGERFGVQQDVPVDLSPSFLYVGELPEYVVVRQIMAAIDLTGPQTRCAEYFVPIVRGAEAQDWSAELIVSAAREIVDEVTAAAGAAVIDSELLS